MRPERDGAPAIYASKVSKQRSLPQIGHSLLHRCCTTSHRKAVKTGMGRGVSNCRKKATLISWKNQLALRCAFQPRLFRAS